MNSLDNSWKGMRCSRFRISLNHLRPQIAYKMLESAGWKREFCTDSSIDSYSLKHPTYNLESIFIALHPRFNDSEQTICPPYVPRLSKSYLEKTEKYCTDEELVEYDYFGEFKEQECFYIDTNRLGTLMPDKTVIERNWGNHKHKVFHISLNDLKDEVKHVLLYQTGWLSSLKINIDNLRLAETFYTLNCVNSNNWSFRVISSDSESETTVEWVPTVEKKKEHHHTDKKLTTIFSELKEKVQTNENEKNSYLNNKRVIQDELYKNQTKCCEKSPETTNSKTVDSEKREIINSHKFFDYESDSSNMSMPPLVDENSNTIDVNIESDIFINDNIADDDSEDYNLYKKYDDYY